MWFRRIFEYCCSYIDHYRAQWPGLPVPSAPGTCLPWANPKSFFNEVQNERVVHDFVSNWTISQSVWIKSWSLKWLTDVVKIAKLILTHAIRLAIWARAVNRNMVVYHFELESFHLRLDQSSWHSWRQKVPVSLFHTRIHQTRRIQKNPLCKTVSKNTVEPPVSDHPKCKVLVVAVVAHLLYEK